MKDMTTAEFAKANLAALDEAISVRRYTKVIGTYYPAGVVPIEAPDLGLVEPAMTGAATKIRDLELEVKHLKRELAARPMVTTRSPDLRLVANDPFAGLPKQDRDFFERKLGKTKK